MAVYFNPQLMRRHLLSTSYTQTSKCQDLAFRDVKESHCSQGMEVQKRSLIVGSTWWRQTDVERIETTLGAGIVSLFI